MKEVKEKYLKEIYLNVLKAIIIVLYFLVLNLAYENISSEHLELGIEIFTMIFLFISIYIFEKAYKKDDGNLAIQGIEILVLSTYTLTSRHITNKFNFEFKNYSLVASYIFAIYFILKCIVVYTKGRKEEAENFSDIREIVKKDEPLKKEATKKTKEDKTKDIQNENNEKVTVVKKKTTSAKKTTNKKSTASKKESASSKKNTTNKTKAHKKIEDKDQKTEKPKDEKQESEKPKRKRVKKEVKEND